MLELLKVFSKQTDIIYEGAMIAKAKYEKILDDIEAVDFKNELIKESKRLCVIKCLGYKNDLVIESLTVYLMMTPQIKKDVAKETMKGEYWYTFSSEEIKAFSYDTGDSNSIHLTDHPIVQGLYILKKLYESTLAKFIEIKYLYPIYAGEPVLLEYDENSISAYSNDHQCFLATMKR